MKNGNRLKLLILNLFLCTFTYAQNTNFVEKIHGFHLWTKGAAVGASERLLFNSVLAKALADIKAMDFVVQLQAQGELAVILDASWKHSSAYWDESLRDPKGHRAIVVAPSALSSSWQVKQLLIHEFMHMYHHNLRPHDEGWVQEGVALLSEYVYTGNYNVHIDSGFLFPELSLNTVLQTDQQSSVENPNLRVALYGQVGLFFIYAFKQCGGMTFYKALFDSKNTEKNGIEFLNKIFSKTNLESCSTFPSLFKKFSIARFEGSVLPGYLKSPLRDEKIQLDPYSSSAYKISKGEQCEDHEIHLKEQNACVRIRLQ